MLKEQKSAPMHAEEIGFDKRRVKSAIRAVGPLQTESY